MMKKQRTKEMSGEEPELKTKEIESDNPFVSKPKKLICLRECDMPGVGSFKGGEIIEDELKIARIADNPNFKEILEEETI